MLSQEQLQQIKLSEAKAKLSKRVERYQYLGLYDEYQLHPKSIINSFQYSKFKRVLHGLKVYKPEEVRKLHWDKKRRITRVWKRAQKELNAWKQMLCNKKINHYLSTTFKHSSLAQYIASFPPEEVLDDYTNTMTFKELGINYEDVILKFMSLGLLPRNYFTIKSNGN